MSLIVQLGTTNVGYTPTFNTSVGTVAVSSHAATSAVSRVVNTNQVQVAKHRLPMTINRQPQQHTLPVRNIAVLARPIQQTPVMASSTASAATTTVAHIQNQNTMPVVAGRVLASPVKDASLDDDLLEGVVEKRPKYHKHLPLNYQYVLQDHNYGAPPPPTPPAVSPSKSPINGMPASNGISVSHGHSHTHAHPHPHVHNRPPPVHPQPNSYSSSLIYNNSRQVPNVLSAVNDIESDVSSDGEREVEPEGEETETAPEGEGDIDDEDSVTRCICDFQHDDGYMICCDRCSVWQHVDCMGIDRANIPDEYLCEKCQPRRVEKQRAIALQIRKRRELFDTSDSSSETSSSSDNPAALKPAIRKRAVVARRRSEPIRKPSISSSAKPRRESAKEISSQLSVRQNNRQANRKRHVEKRPPARRKNAAVNSNSLNNSSSSSSNVEKKSSTQSLSSLASSTSTSSSSLSSSSTSSLTSDKVNNHDKNLTSPNSNSDSVQQLRQWIDSYEEAVTNHYSPELRARIGNIKVNGIHSDLRLPSNLLATPKIRLSLLPSGTKILMTNMNVTANQPLIELRGKYMLCGSSGTGLTNRPPRPAAPPPPGPHIFHYKLPRDNTEVCVDCRTYGNDARFVRRSCQPNAEIRHCIEKGTLHLYIVTTSAVDKNCEVTIPFTLMCGVPCICGEKDCLIKKENEVMVKRESPPRNQEKKNGVLKATNNVVPASNSQSTVEKRRRGRRRTASENQTPDNNRVSEKVNSVKQNSTTSEKATPPAEKTQPPASPPSPPSLPPLTRSASSGSRPNKTTTASVTSNTSSTRNASPAVNKKDESTKSNSNNATSNNNNITSNNNNNNNKTKDNNSSSNNNNNNNISNHNNENQDDEVNNKKNITSNNNKDSNSNSVTESEKKEDADKKKKMTREERKLEAIMKAFERMEKDQAKRVTQHRQAQQRKDSTDAEKEKQAAAVEAKTTSTKEKEREEQMASNNRNNSIRKRRRKGRGRSHPMQQPVSRARARRAVRRSRNSSSNSRTLSNNQDDSDSGHSTDNEMNEDSQSPKKQPSSSNVSQAADLLMSLSAQNNYVDEKEHEEDGALYRRSTSYPSDNKDHPDEHTEEDDDDDGMQRLNTSTSSSDTPPTPLSNTCLVVAAAVGSLGFKFPKTKKGLLNTWFKAPDPGSPPLIPAPDDSPTRPGPGKKRWLRQAISEECESPSRPEMSVSPTDYVAPLKKRRLARESISSEQSFTPPTTPMEPTNQLNYDDEEEDSFAVIREKHVNYDENDGGCSSAESDADSPAGPRTPAGPEPRSEADSVKEEKNVDVDNSCHTYEEKNDIKDKVIDKEESDKKEKKNTTPARKKVLSISEYRQRKMQGGRESHDGEIDGEEGDGSEVSAGAINIVTSSPRSHSSESSSMSSSDEEENRNNTVSKSLLLGVSAPLPKPGGGTSRFNCAPTLKERQRENLTERLKREFGLFLSDDEETIAARRQSLSSEIPLQAVQLSSVVTTPGTSVPTLAEKKDPTPLIGGEKEKRKKPPPPPPPPLPMPGHMANAYPMYPGYMPGVRGPAVYSQPYGIPPPLPPPALEPVNVGSAAPYYGPPNAYYGQHPHTH